jgi:hypothetical protein
MSDPTKPLKRQRSEPLTEEPPSSRQKLTMSSEAVAGASGDADQMMVDAEPIAELVRGTDSDPLMSGSLLSALSLSEPGDSPQRP